MIVLKTVSDLQHFIDGVKIKARHHAKYALPLIGPLVGAVIQVADRDADLRATEYLAKTGLQLHFKYRGYDFKLQHWSDEKVIVLKERHGTEDLAIFESTLNYDVLVRLKAGLDKVARPELREAV